MRNTGPREMVIVIIIKIGRKKKKDRLEGKGSKNGSGPTARIGINNIFDRTGTATSRYCACACGKYGILYILYIYIYIYVYSLIYRCNSVPVGWERAAVGKNVRIFFSCFCRHSCTFVFHFLFFWTRYFLYDVRSIIFLILFNYFFFFFENWKICERSKLLIKFHRRGWCVF